MRIGWHTDTGHKKSDLVVDIIMYILLVVGIVILIYSYVAYGL